MSWFQEGGWAMYPLVCTGLFGFVLGLAAVGVAFAKKKTPAIALGALAMTFALLGCAVMGFGYFEARRSISAALVNVDPTQREAMEAMGLSEASNILTFGVCSGVLPLLFGAIALARGATLKTEGK